MAQKFPYTPTAGALVQFLNQFRKSFPPVVDSAIWPAPGLDDTDLSESSLPLELHRA